MKSPCIKVCQMDPQRGLCIGCGRTLDEIARWAEMSDAERERVLAQLPSRGFLLHGGNSGSVPELRS